MKFICNACWTDDREYLSRGPSFVDRECLLCRRTVLDTEGNYVADIRVELLDGELRELLSFSAFGRNWRRARGPLRSSVRLAAFTLADLRALFPLLAAAG